MRRLAAALVVIAVMATGCHRPIQLSPHALEDAQLGVRVKTVLVNDAQLGPRIIEVGVDRGVVSLTGLVASAAEADRAVVLTRGVPGVTDVRSQLVVGTPPGGAASVAPPPSPAAQEVNASRRRWLAIGASVTARQPTDESLASSVAVGPMLRLGAGRGLGLTLGFSWFDADLSPAPSRATLGHVTIRPLMAGPSYTLTDQARWALSLSLVGGMAFNSVSFGESTAPDGVPLEVADSAAVRPGVSLWFDLNSRAAFNVFSGYVITRPQMTFLENGQFERRAVRADTAVYSVGVAYKLF